MLKDRGATVRYLCQQMRSQANECAGFATRAQADLLEECLIWLAVNGCKIRNWLPLLLQIFAFSWDLSDDIHVVKNHWVG